MARLEIDALIIKSQTPRRIRSSFVKVPSINDIVSTYVDKNDCVKSKYDKPHIYNLDICCSGFDEKLKSW